MKKAKAHFPKMGPIKYKGPQPANALAFKYYNPKALIDGKILSRRLRQEDEVIAVLDEFLFFQRQN